jgi:AcrR family transcriptional regulator
MPRPRGRPNADFAQTRQELLDRLRSTLLGQNPPSSFRALAVAAQVTIPTLRHYFGGREEVLAAVFADCHAGGQHHLEIAATPTGPFAQSIHDFIQHVVGGFRFGGLRELHTVGLKEGLPDQPVALSYLAEILEPTLLACQKRLEAHIARQEMRTTDARHAAIGLISPLLVVFLHQQALGGAAAFPLDIDTFAKDHEQAFVTAYATPATA